MNDKEKQIIIEEGRKLALLHWSYLGKLCEKMYIDAFIHGYKHGRIADFEEMERLMKELFKRY